LKNSDISSLDPARKAQLVAAGYVLVGWVHTRRASWPIQPAVISAPVLPEVDVRPRAVEVVEVIEAIEPVEPVEPSDPVWPLGPVATLPGEFQPDTAFPGAFSLEDEPDDSPDLIPEAPVVRAPWPTFQFHLPIDAIRSVGAPLLRLGAVAAAIGIVAAAGWAAVPYVKQLLAAPTTGTAVFESIPPSEILVDGVSIGTAPLSAQLAIGHHVVGFRRRSGVHTVEIDVAGGKSTRASYDWDAALFGRVTVRSDPPGARVLIDGKDLGVTPLMLENVAVGAHTVLIETGQGSVQRTVNVSPDRVAAISESLFPGWLKLFAPFEVQITEGTAAVRLDEQSQVMLAPGVHELRFENRALGYRDTRRVEVRPGQTTSLSLAPSPSSLTVVSNLPAIVIVDGAEVGGTPLTNHPLALGTHDIIVRTPAGVERRFATAVTVAPVALDVTF
jgi:hypothetical protein